MSTPTPEAMAAPDPTPPAAPTPGIVAAVPTTRSNPTPTTGIAAATTTGIAATPTTPTPTPTLGIAAAAPDPNFQVEFPDWVEQSPGMALQIVVSDVIAKAKFVSLDSIVIKRRDSEDYSAKLTYKFEAVQYLKGDGPNELVVGMNSGPKYQLFPDVLEQRTESEAHQLAETWLRRSINRFNNKEDAILLVRGPRDGGDYQFTSVDEGRGRGGHPTFGETWLVENTATAYQHQFTGTESETISRSDLSALIEDMRPLMEGEYGPCAARALGYRSQVRDQLLGTYQELTLAGYREPKAFPRYAAEVESEWSENAKVFRSYRPPYQSPRFSDYWLDGRDKDLFNIYNGADHTYSYESLRTVRALPQGEYSVHYSQYHESLPCVGPPYYFGDNDWRTMETTEWVAKVTTP